jgi:hypothetical protein
VSSPPTKGGGYTIAGRRGGWGVNILEDERHRIGLLQYNLSTTCTVKKRIFIYIEGNSGSDLVVKLQDEFSPERLE